MSEQLNNTTESYMRERFGKDSLIALATVEDGVPHVRTVDSFYEEGAFYIVTDERTNKMKQIAKNPIVAISGEWFTAHGKGESLGWIKAKENEKLAKKVLDIFAEWVMNGHSDLNDENTVILKITLTDGILYRQGIRYNIEF